MTLTAASRLALLATLALFLLTGCRPEPEDQPSQPASAESELSSPQTKPAEPERSVPRPSKRELAGDFIRGRVVETMDASGYTYVLVDADGDEAWAAAPQFAVGLGDEVTVTTSMPMPKHHSQTLDRTFELVYFCSRIEIEGQATEVQAMEAAHSQATPTATLDLSGIARADGGSTVAEVHGQAKKLSGKQVAIRGRVVKYSSGIMGRNWLHLQDGSGVGETADLTITTKGEATVGDLVLIEGQVATDQDFGYGYAYAVMIKDAKITVE